MSILHRGARVGAATVVVGFSLAWPQVAGVAAADSPEKDTSTVSSGPAKAGTPANSRPTPAARSRAAGAPARSAAAGSPHSSAGSRAAAARPSAAASRVQPAPRTRTVETSVAEATVAETTSNTGSATRPEAATQTPTSVVATVDPGPAPTIAKAAPVAAVPATPGKIGGLRVHAAAGALPSITDVLSGLVGGVQSLIEGVGLLVRRALFNQAPTVLPVQTSGQTVGVIGGSVNAVDPENDKITYTFTQPTHGTVSVDSNGNYVYTPNDPGWTGTDSFTVSAKDTGLHINLFNLSRPDSTEATVTIVQNGGAPQVGYTFVFGKGARYWSSDARAALENSALDLAGYFVVTQPVIITYDVTGQKTFTGSTLASAGSDLVDTVPGFYGTVVQQKILTGVDANGSAADGQIDWNFGYSWALGNTVAPNQYDFESTALHELLHSFGFLSVIDSAGNNTDPNWTTFDSFVVAYDGTNTVSPINHTTYVWNTAYNSDLTGGSGPYGGLYFGGPNAEAAYGGKPVPLYTPRPWESGSSMSHLDDATFTGANSQLMNAVSDTGLGIRTLSTIEIGILKDLGYTMTSPPQTLAIVIIGFAFIRRRRRGEQKLAQIGMR